MRTNEKRSSKVRNIKMKDLPIGELALWTNNNKTTFLLYLFNPFPGRRYMRILSTTGSTHSCEIGIVNDDWEVIALGVQTTENPYEVYRRVLKEGAEIVKEITEI